MIRSSMASPTITTFLATCIATLLIPIISACRSEPANAGELQAMISAARDPIAFTQSGQAEPEFLLSDDRGVIFDNDRLQEHWTLVLVGYTSCPDVCPTALTSLGKAIPLLRSKFQNVKFQYLFLGVDPVRDQDIDLHQYAGHFHQDIRILTGETKQIDNLIRYLGASYRILNQHKGYYTVDHSTSLFVLDPDAKMVATILRPHSGQEIVRGFQQIIEKLPQKPIKRPLNTNQDSLNISRAWVKRPPPSARVAAGFVDFHNQSNKTVTIVKLESPHFERVEFHDITIKNDIAKMIHLPTIVVQPEGRIEFRPGAKHIMLIGPKRTNTLQGKSVGIVLTLDSGTKIPIELPLLAEAPGQ